MIDAASPFPTARAIHIAAIARPTYVRLALPQEIDAGFGGGYRTLRIVDDRNVEVAYVLDPGERRAGDAVVLHRLRGTSSISHRDRQTTLAFDFGTANVEVAGFRFDAVQREFARDVAIEASDDASIWRHVSEGRVARYANGVPHLTVDARGDRARYWRARIDDQDDRPIAGLRANAYATTHAIAFEALPRRSYRIQWGANDEAPAYDLHDRLEHDRPTAFATAIVGEPKPARTPRPARPIVQGKTSRFFALAFGVVLLVLGGVGIANARASR